MVDEKVAYRTIRRIVGVLGIALPVVVAVWYYWLCGTFLPTISDSQDTPARDAFVAILSTVALLLFAYRGPDVVDRVAGKLACVCSLGVAFIPHENVLHGASAALMFLILAYFSFFLFTRTSGEPTTQKLKRNLVYRVCGVVIFLSIVGCGLYFWALRDQPDLWWACRPVQRVPVVYILEAIGLVAFGVSWLVKGETVLTDRPHGFLDQVIGGAVQRLLQGHPAPAPRLDGLTSPDRWNWYNARPSFGRLWRSALPYLAGVFVLRLPFGPGFPMPAWLPKHFPGLAKDLCFGLSSDPLRLGVEPDTIRRFIPVTILWSLTCLVSGLPAPRWVRRATALVFWLVLASAGGTLANLLADEKPPIWTKAVWSVVSLIAIAHMAIGLRAEPGNQPNEGPVRADDLVPGLGQIWRGQGLFLLVVAAWTGSIQGADHRLDALPEPLKGVTGLATPLPSVQAMALGLLGVLSWIAVGPNTKRNWMRLQALFGVTLLLGPVVAWFDEPHPSSLAFAAGVIVVCLGAANMLGVFWTDWLGSTVKTLHDGRGTFFTAFGALCVFGGAGWLLAARPLLMILGRIPDACAPDVDSGLLLGVHTTRLIGPLAIGIGMMGFAAAMRRSEQMRQAAVRIAFVWLALWVGVFWYNVTDHLKVAPHDISGLAWFIGGSLTGMLAWATPLAVFDAPPPTLWLTRGTAQTAPIGIRAVWVVQAGWFLVVGALLLFDAQGSGERLIAAEHRVPPTTVTTPLQLSKECVDACRALQHADGSGEPTFCVEPLNSPTGYYAPRSLEVDQLRITGSYWVGMSMLSYYATSVAWPFAWRQMSLLFLAWEGMYAGVLLFAVDDSFYGRAPFVHLGLLAVFILGQLIARRARHPISDLAKDDDPDGMLGMDLLAAFPMALQVLQRRRRASHLVGVGARGRFEPCPDKRVPWTPWFDHVSDPKRAPRSIPVSARFANLTRTDDAALDVRGLSISIRPAGAARFDLLMNTGTAAAPSHVLEFVGLVLSKWAPTWLERRLLLSLARLREGGVMGVRLGPDSFLSLVYHGQLVRSWVGGPDPRRPQAHLVRFRVVPKALLDAQDKTVRPCLPPAPIQESGLPEGWARADTLWVRTRRPGDMRDTDYLRQELRGRLPLEPSGGEEPDGCESTSAATGAPPKPVREERLVVQAQFRVAEDPGLKSGPNLAIYDASIDWDERCCPWLTLGEVVLTAALDPDKTEELCFDPSKMPAFLGAPRPAGILDPRSTGDAEVRTTRAVQRFRRLVQQVLGVPPTS